MQILLLYVFPHHMHRKVFRRPSLPVRGFLIKLIFLWTTNKKSKNCKKELEYADKLDKELIVVKLDPDADILGHGGISIILANLIYVSSKFNCVDSQKPTISDSKWWWRTLVWRDWSATSNQVQKFESIFDKWCCQWWRKRNWSVRCKSHWTKSWQHMQIMRITENLACIGIIYKFDNCWYYCRYYFKWQK